MTPLFIDAFQRHHLTWALFQIGFRLAEFIQNFDLHRDSPKVLATTATAPTLIFDWDKALVVCGEGL